MSKLNRSEAYPIRIKPFALVLALIWSAAVTTSLVWNVYKTRQEILNVARIQARNYFIKDVIYRQWNSEHGGVYVPVTDETPPNPYLKVPERDITTHSGVVLTLMNPAYMTRQIHELASKIRGIQSHITSLNPIRPENAPDPWENSALEAFQNGSEEISSIEKASGDTFMRLMRPLVTEKDCLKCHAAQGYKVGDIRGGISVSIPMSPLRAVERSHLLTLSLAHGLLWLVGLVGIGLGTYRLIKQVTERKQTEESLIATQARLKHLLTSSPAVIYSCKPAGDYSATFISENVKTQLGYEPQEFTEDSKFWTEHIHPEDRPRVFSELSKLFEQGNHTHEYRFQHKDGAYRWMRDELRLVYDDEGTPLDIVGYWIDIHERKLAEEALRESEERYRILIEAASRSGQAIIVHQDRNDVVGACVFANDTAVKMTGYSEEELSVLSWMKILHPDYFDSALNRYKRRMGGEDIPGLFELSIIRKDGVEVPIEVSSIRSEFHGETALITFLRDITDRKQAEETIKQSEEFLNTIVENIPDMIFVKDAKDLRFVRSNNAGEELLGYSREDLIGKNDYDFFPKEEADFFTEKDREVLNSGKLLDITEEPIQTKYKGERILHTKKIPILDEDGKPKYLLSISEDITEHKRMEEVHKRLEDQLQQAYKMEAIGTLAGGIAHDFNNILTPIIIQSELALMDVDDGSPVQFNLQEVMKAGLRAKDLVKQILTFSRQSEQQPVPLKITPIIKEAIKLLRASLPTTIEIRLNLTKSADTVIADPTQIHQVLMNLCTNSSHAMRETGGILDISLFEVEVDSDFATKHTDMEPGPYLNLAVSDTGHGISPDVIDRILEPFFTTKDRSEGTGMGLAVVHGIIKSYGGTITIESELGKGTTFNVFLPRIKTVISEKTEPDRQLPTGNERILVVDDEKGMVDTLRKMLKKLGYQTVGKTSSLEALKIFETDPDQFDLVITDQTMPKMTGMELAKTFMSIRSDIRIILCTGFSERVNEESAKAMGISAFVLKPIVMRDIAHTIRKVLGDEK